MRTACDIVLTDKERRTLQRCSRGRSTSARLALRSRIVLLAAKGLMNKDIAKEVGTSRQSVGLWRSRFAERRLRNIDYDAPRGGQKPTRRDRVARLILRERRSSASRSRASARPKLWTMCAAGRRFSGSQRVSANW